MILFNARTGETKQISESTIRMLHRYQESWEHLFEIDEALTLKQRQQLLNDCQIEGEFFRSVPGTVGVLVSNYGRVKRVYPVSQKERMLMPFSRNNANKTKAIYVKININGKLKEIKVSKVVAMCFQLQGKGTCVCHINKNPWDNRVDNLKWMKPNELTKFPQRMNRQSVIKIDPVTLEELEYYPSIREAGRQENLSHETIRLCLKGKQKTAGGYLWRYDKEL